MAIQNPVLANYSANPTTQAGSGAYGAVPGAVATPPSTYEQLSGVLPQLSSLTNQNANLIGQQMSGVVPTDVIKQIQDQAASWGVSSGMPGSGLSQNMSLRNLGLTSMQEQQTGQNNYLNTASGLGGLQLDPSLLTSLGQYNATMAAAPNPQAAADQQMQDYLQFLNPAFVSQEAGASNLYRQLTNPGAGTKTSTAPTVTNSWTDALGQTHPGTPPG